MSESLLGSGMMGTRGLPVPADKPIGISALTAKVLCSKHNSDLSLLDDEIKKLGDALAGLTAPNSNNTLKISGALIERWLLKVVAGSMVSGWLPFSSPPSERLVRCVYGISRVPANWSLHGVAPVAIVREHHRAFGLSFVKADSPDRGIGVLFNVSGMALLLAMNLDDPTTAVRSLAPAYTHGIDLSRAIVKRHPEALAASTDHGHKLQIEFVWKKRWAR